MRHSKQGCRRSQAGFTLVEILLALLIFSIIAAAIFAAFAAISKGVERGRGSADFYHVGRVALRRIGQELQGAFQFTGAEDRGGTVPSYINTPLKGEDATANGMPRDRLMFLTIPYQRFPEQAPKNELCHVCYYVGNNAQGVAALFRYQDCTLVPGEDDDERCHGKQEPLELTDVVVGLDVTYYDQDGEAHDAWPPDDPHGLLPCQARLTLFLQQAEQQVRPLSTTVTFPMRGKCEPQS